MLGITALNGASVGMWLRQHTDRDHFFFPAEDSKGWFRFETFLIGRLEPLFEGGLRWAAEARVEGPWRITPASARIGPFTRALSLQDPSTVSATNAAVHGRVSWHPVHGRFRAP